MLQDRPVLVGPAAQALLAEMAATAVSTLLGAGLGLAACRHAVPFQRPIRVVVVAMAPKQWPARPTAQALLAEVTATPNRAPPSVGVGLAPFGQVQQWTALIAALEDSLRLHRNRPGTLPGLGRYLHQRTHGMIGRLLWLIRSAAISAVLDGQPLPPTHDQA